MRSYPRIAPSRHRPTSPHDDPLAALVNGRRLASVVPAVLDIVEKDPLASAGAFRGDLLRALMEVPGSFWSRHPALFNRYRAAVRAGAMARMRLPPELRAEFWNALAVTDRDDLQPDPAA